MGVGERIKETLPSELFVGIRPVSVPMVSTTVRTVLFELLVQLALTAPREPVVVEDGAVAGLVAEFVTVTNTVCITVLVRR